MNLFFGLVNPVSLTTDEYTVQNYYSSLTVKKKLTKKQNRNLVTHVFHMERENKDYLFLNQANSSYMMTDAKPIHSLPALVHMRTQNLHKYMRDRV